MVRRNSQHGHPHIIMKLSAAFSILLALRAMIQVAFMPTFYAVLGSPSVLLRPRVISRIFMAKLWIVFGNGVDENSRAIKQQLITPNAYGVVLDIGAGYGHTANYLDKSRVMRYIALEPNTEMHSGLRSLANAAGFKESDGTLLILSCGAQDIASIVSYINEYSVDTLVSILTICSIPSPENTLTDIVSRVLKPGGQLLLYEHVLSSLPDVAWWQRFWTPIWSLVVDGCRLDCPTELWLARMENEDGGGMWSEKSFWAEEEESGEQLLYHRSGKLVKHLI